jgi:hypothetical protein
MERDWQGPAVRATVWVVRAYRPRALGVRSPRWDADKPVPLQAGRDATLGRTQVP